MIGMLFLMLVLFLLLGVPIYITLALAPLIYTTVFLDISPAISIARMFAGLDRFALMSVPFYIFAANLMQNGGISKRILNFAEACLGKFNGGLALTTIVASMFFAALSGSSQATVIAIGTLMYPALLAKGYSKGFSAGLLSSVGSIGIIIPPSINFILYAAITGTSVAALFMAGFGAGIIYGIAFMVYSLWFVKSKHVVDYCTGQGMSKLKALRESSWALGVPVIIIGGIYTGKFTPTEAAAVSVAYATFVSMVIYREMSWKQFYKEAYRSAAITAQVMIMVAAASFFSWVLTSENVARYATDLVINLGSSKIIFLLLVNILLLIEGMFIDGASATLISTPLLAPIASSLGIDLVHFGVIITVNMAIGMFTPPFGLNLFVSSSITKLSQEELSRAVLPFILITVVALLFITYIPQISMWLPNMIYGR